MHKRHWYLLMAILIKKKRVKQKVYKWIKTCRLPYKGPLHYSVVSLADSRESLNLWGLVSMHAATSNTVSKPFYEHKFIFLCSRRHHKCLIKHPLKWILQVLHDHFITSVNWCRKLERTDDFILKKGSGVEVNSEAYTKSSSLQRWDNSFRLHGQLNTGWYVMTKTLSNSWFWYVRVVSSSRIGIQEEQHPVFHT